MITPTSAPPGLRARRSRRMVLLIAIVVVIALLVPPGRSYVGALAAPGSAPWQVRTVDWIRDHGGSPVVNFVENAYYRWHAPPNSVPDPTQLPAVGQQTPSVHPPTSPSPRTAATLPTLPLLPGRKQLPGEAQWFAGRTDRHGLPLMYSAYFRPDAAHASVVAGIAWIRQSGTAAHLVAGLSQPGGPPWSGGAMIRRADVPYLVATFNSGWRMKDLTGGFSAGGRTAGRLVRGQATAVIDRNGRVGIGALGRDVAVTSNIVAARQNLRLIVDRGAAVRGLMTNDGDQWGFAGNQFQFTARSGIGIDRNGNLIYVAADGVQLSTLADTLARAGAVRAMELDVHRRMTFFASWLPQRDGSITATKLLPSMTRPAERYLAPDERDFFYITAEH